METKKITPIMISGAFVSGKAVLGHLLEGHSKVLAVPFWHDMMVDTFISYLRRLGSEMSSVNTSDIRNDTRHMILLRKHLSGNGYLLLEAHSLRQEAIGLTSAGSFDFLDFEFDFYKFNEIFFRTVYGMTVEDISMGSLLNQFCKIFVKNLRGFKNTYDNIRYFISTSDPGFSEYGYMFEQYDDIKVIYIKRNTSEWFLSLVKRTHLLNTTPNDRTLEFVKNDPRLLASINMDLKCYEYQELYPDRFLVIDFNDLITTHEEIIRKISEFLNLGFEDILLKPTWLSKEFSGSDKLLGNVMDSDENLNLDEPLRKSSLELLEKLIKKCKNAGEEYEHNAFRKKVRDIVLKISPTYRAIFETRENLKKISAYSRAIVKNQNNMAQLNNSIIKRLDALSFFDYNISNLAHSEISLNSGGVTRRIKIYIVTYKRNDVLNANLASLWATASDPSVFDVTILANHPDVDVYEENRRDNLRVVLNSTRNPHAWGYLSRDWNYCILDCFKNWRNPLDIEWCLLVQNDVIWIDGWQDFIKTNTMYDMVTQPTGDQLIALNIEAVKKVGFFDERFTTLHFQEQDYFIRASYWLNKRVSINDTHTASKGDSNFNPVGNVISLTGASGINLRDPELHTPRTNSMFGKVIKEKYGFNHHSDCFKRMLAYNHVVANKLEKTEVNWYPFFWDGYNEIETTFMFDDKRTN